MATEYEEPVEIKHEEDYEMSYYESETGQETWESDATGNGLADIKEDPCDIKFEIFDEPGESNASDNEHREDASFMSKADSESVQSKQSVQVRHDHRANKAKRKRSANWPFSDKLTLISLVEEKKAIVGCKASSSVILQEKSKAWDDITSSLNATSEVHRSKESVITKFNSLKSATRKKMDAIKRSSSNAPTLDPVEERIAAILRISGSALEADFDSDANITNEEQSHFVSTTDTKGADEALSLPNEMVVQSENEPTAMPKTKNYDPQLLESAVADVRSGKLSKKAAAKQYGVPRATIQFRLSEKFSKSSKGPTPILSTEEENTLEDWILDSCRKGFPCRKEDVKLSVQIYLNKNKRQSPFPNNLPGEGWYRAFLKRHPRISLREPEAVTRVNAPVSVENIRGWFKQVEDYLREENLLSVLDDPSRIFNGYETGFLFNPKTGKVLAEEGVRNVNEADKACAKTSITVMFTCSAAGDMCPPMILYPYKRLPADVAKSVPDSWGIGLKESEWMVAEAFYEYMAKILIPHFKENCKLPVILFLYRHRSHLSLHLSNLCREAGVILVSRIIQPCDVSVLKGLKTEWKKAVSTWYTRNHDASLTKEHFAPVLKSAMDGIKREWIVNGFRKNGLCPWSPFAFDDNLILGTTSTPIEPPLTATISYEQFKAVVGNSEVDRLLKGGATDNESNTLRNLIQCFKVNPEETPPLEGSDVAMSEHDVKPMADKGP